jgi:hypothetical protein
MWKLYAGIAFIGAGIVLMLLSNTINLGEIFKFPMLSP